jgi:hypothetical protein
MTFPRTTPGVRRLLLAALLTIAVVTLATASAQAAPAPDRDRGYLVTADLDGRDYPRKDATVPDGENFLRKGQRVGIQCQEYGGEAYGSKLWDLVTRNGQTLYVPDRFIKTGFDGRAPDIRSCGIYDEADHPYETDPFD